MSDKPTAQEIRDWVSANYGKHVSVAIKAAEAAKHFELMPSYIEPILRRQGRQGNVKMGRKPNDPNAKRRVCRFCGAWHRCSE